VEAETAMAELVQAPDAWLRTCAIMQMGIIRRNNPWKACEHYPAWTGCCCCGGCPLLEDLTPEELQRVAAISTDQDFEEGELICEQGEPGDQMFVIVSGKCGWW